MGPPRRRGNPCRRASPRGILPQHATTTHFRGTERGVHCNASDGAVKGFHHQFEWQRYSSSPQVYQDISLSPRPQHQIWIVEGEWGAVVVQEPNAILPIHLHCALSSTSEVFCFTVRFCSLFIPSYVSYLERHLYSAKMGREPPIPFRVEQVGEFPHAGCSRRQLCAPAPRQNVRIA